ncbi:unnamed protein product [Didymodactylos carnosus]|uniref:TIR domain-containing protein n=1 Tax=Didymodactylos carnosus TaxID=1234261 RepID=A0A815FXD3_9BILA|nr:unnamed protein product [Didymodactylos carnosus]CAF1331151.1 unnamed protein product [Didymodactylos carnosus]CAF3964343.1 unnamed protein product [Didymodactylos carnosus]CAF4184748.1 unnamed protein product [Didymodactylos carnosus]
MESQFHETKIQLHALKILISLTFHNDGKRLLENNHDFLDHLRVIIESSKLMDFQNIADGILWRLSSKDEKTESKYQYDMMISYAHKDKDICHQIHKSLINDNYRVWIDLERMHGIIMEAIANAIEQSRCVLICMSDTYSHSPYCQSEAQYAFEKRRLLIPLKVQDGFKPQGWLAFTISGRMYVDFIKMDFQTAYQQLRSQFYQNQIDKKNVSSKPAKSYLTEEPKEKEQIIVYSYPKDIHQWSAVHVPNFLLDKHLSQMIPICQEMDGRRLMELYELCSKNSPLMLQTLRCETTELHVLPSSINIYLKFLYEMKKLKPDPTSDNQVVSPSKVCTLIRVMQLVKE